MRRVFNRLKGCGLLVLTLGPPVVIAAGIGFAVKVTVDVVQLTRDKVESIADTINGQITPQLAAVRATYDGLVANADRLDAQISHVFQTLSSLQDLRIEPGQLGSSSPQHLQVPPQGVSLGFIDVPKGRLMDETLPGISIPDRPVTIPVEPLRVAFAPLGKDGPVGRAIEAAQGELRKTVGAVEKLGTPLNSVFDAAAGWLAPLKNAAVRLVAVVGAMLLALVTLLLVCVAAGIHFAVRRRAEAATVYRTGGTFGYLRYVYRSLMMDGFARLFGRAPAAASRPSSTRDLSSLVETLQAELRALRAEVERSRYRQPELAAE
jgi:hypothetical protein